MASVPSSGKTGFTLLPPGQTGITFTNFLSEQKGLENSMRLSGSGVAAGDVDGDAWCDLFFCGLEKPSALYRNLGNWKFEDVTASAGVACAGQYSTGAVFTDVDGDGDLDLLVNSIGGGTRLFLNNGKGHFIEATDCGLLRKYGSTSMALADVDGNGTLDLYVANYAATKIEDRPNTKFDVKMVNGRQVIAALDGVPTTSPELTNRYLVDPADHVVRERGEPDVLYLNDGHGKFKPVPWTDGTFLDEAGKPLLFPPYDWGLSVMFHDLDGDGAPDIYVCNDLFTPDRIWINDGRGHFRPLSNLAVRQTSRFSMGIDFADINRDGYDDFLVVDMLSREHRQRKVQVWGVQPVALPIGQIDNRPQYKRNTLFLNRGDGTFAELAQLSGLEATEWSWMPLFIDVDLDGYEDLLVTTGYTRDSLNADAVMLMRKLRGNGKLSDAQYRELKKRFPILNLPKQAFRNRGDLTFEDKAHEWGFDDVGISQGMCLADLDNDGDLDVAVNTLNAAAGIYRNESIAPRVAVRLKGKEPNTRGIGAKIKFLGGPMPQSQEMICGGRYMSADDAMRVFAPGSATNGLRIEVIWRSGKRSFVSDVKPNYVYEIDENGAGAAGASQRRSVGAGERQNGSALGNQNSSAQDSENYAPRSPLSAPRFEDVSQLLKHTHLDEPFDDLARQPLLWKKLSQLGPGVSWFDVDGDGWEDLIIGSGKGGPMAVYRNEGRGGFSRAARTLLETNMPRDQTTILGCANGNRGPVLLAGSSNYEDGSAECSPVRRFDLANGSGRIEDCLPSQISSAGPLALADVDGSGSLALFVGGRVIPGRYPEAASSILCRRAGEQWQTDAERSKVFRNVGLVSGAVFSDLDGDGFPELILACDWGPVKIFRNQGGQFREITRESGLDNFTGWWNGVTTGDFDGDGRPDIVASNWGRNSRYESYRQQPLLVYYGSGRANDFLDVLEAYYAPELKKFVPWASLEVVEKALPWVREKFSTRAAFGSASVEEILAEHATAMKTLSARWLETTLFLNRGNHFEAHVLPIEAQFAPAFGVGVADMDGDGHEDIFLSQNFFAVDGDTSRHDAGRGLWLRGDGKGGFSAVAGQESGVKVYGEQRGCALCDYDGDGRVDLVVTQNGAATKLFHNVGATPGLRIRLIGTTENPLGIGASVRLFFGQRAGPVREIHAGSGYWSQDSAVQVLSTPEPPTRLWVRWPGGKTNVADVPSGAREVSLDSTGKLKALR